MNPLVLSARVRGTLPTLISHAGEHVGVRFYRQFAISTHDAASPESLLARSKQLFGRESRYWQQRLLGGL